MKNTAIILVVLILAGLGYIFLTRNNDDRVGNTTQTTNVDTSADGSDDRVEKQTITLAAVGGHEASGTANREIDENNQFEHKVEATLNDPAAGKFYEGWLVRGKEGDANFAFISTGKLEKDSDGRWRLNFETGTNYMDYNNVVITLETSANGLDGKPEEHVLEGSF